MTSVNKSLELSIT